MATTVTARTATKVRLYLTVGIGLIVAVIAGLIYVFSAPK
jgi:hypothetical protein